MVIKVDEETTVFVGRHVIVGMCYTSKEQDFIIKGFTNKLDRELPNAKWGVIEIEMDWEDYTATVTFDGVGENDKAYISVNSDGKVLSSNVIYNGRRVNDRF